tara:strand:- start:472 stop:1434 length:963 start_codon:yes stop_codon:yes gene_type:complete
MNQNVYKKMKKISILTPTYNEVENIKDLYESIKKEMLKLDYDYEHIVIDNASNDGTAEILKKLCDDDKKLKVILNNKNYGHLNSPFYGILQTNGDATIYINSDFQDPPELIPEYLKLWEQGSKVVLGQKNKSDENFIIQFLRGLYYKVLSNISASDLTLNTTGSGLFDNSVIQNLKRIDDPIPYLRGLISEIEGDIKLLKFDQPKRKSGRSKNNLFTLFDLAMIGIVKHSKFPLRLMVLTGFIISSISILVSVIFFFYKLLFWNSFNLGIAPMVIGLFFFSGFQIFLLGLVGEYISVILTHVRKLPLVIEKERINFEDKN